MTEEGKVDDAERVKRVNELPIVGREGREDICDGNIFF
jgi:hypothetical protein